MTLLDDLANVAILFKNTFCRSFIVYGSNIIPTIPNCVNTVRNDNEYLYDNVSSRYLLDDTISAYLSPAWQYAFSTVYSVGESKFYMASYWDFRCILAASLYYLPSVKYRYTTSYDRLCNYMVLNPKRQVELIKTLTLLFGEYLMFINDVYPWVDRMDTLERDDLLELLRRRWISFQDIPLAYLECLDVPLLGIDHTLSDLSFVSNLLQVYGTTASDIKVSDVVKFIQKMEFDLFDEIDKLSAATNT